MDVVPRHAMLGDTGPPRHVWRWISGHTLLPTRSATRTPVFFIAGTLEGARRVVADGGGKLDLTGVQIGQGLPQYDLNRFSSSSNRDPSQILHNFESVVLTDTKL